MQSANMQPGGEDQSVLRRRARSACHGFVISLLGAVVPWRTKNVAVRNLSFLALLVLATSIVLVSIGLLVVLGLYYSSHCEMRNETVNLYHGPTPTLWDCLLNSPGCPGDFGSGPLQLVGGGEAATTSAPLVGGEGTSVSPSCDPSLPCPAAPTPEPPCGCSGKTDAPGPVDPYDPRNRSWSSGGDASGLRSSDNQSLLHQGLQEASVFSSEGASSGSSGVSRKLFVPPNPQHQYTPEQIVAAEHRLARYELRDIFTHTHSRVSSSSTPLRVKHYTPFVLNISSLLQLLPQV